MATTNSKIFRARREKIYKPFIDKKALEFWLAPNNMTGESGQVVRIILYIVGNYRAAGRNRLAAQAFCDGEEREGRRTLTAPSNGGDLLFVHIVNANSTVFTGETDCFRDAPGF